MQAKDAHLHANSPTMGSYLIYVMHAAGIPVQQEGSVVSGNRFFEISNELIEEARGENVKQQIFEARHRPH